MLKRECEGVGPCPADILLIGEAPGAEEIKQGQPFVGWAGRTMRNALRAAGIDPATIRIDNVIQRKLVGNDEGKLYLDRNHTIPSDELRAWHEDLIERVRSVRPKVIIAAGEIAFKALAPRPQSMDAVHCYVLRSDRAGCPVVPVYHPAFINRVPELRTWLVHGLRKGRKVLAGQKDTQHSVFLPSKESDLHAVWQYLSECRDKPVAIDIEVNHVSDPTKYKGHIPPFDITSIGFALSESRAMSINFWQPDGSPAWSDDITKQLWHHIDAVLSGPQLKIFHNYIYDTTMLAYHNHPVSGPLYCTMVVANLFTPDLKKRLADLGRTYCFCEPWKDAKDAETYNAEDCYRTYEIYVKQQPQFEKLGLSRYYEAVTSKLLKPVLDMSMLGLPVEKGVMTQIRGQYESEITPLKERLITLAQPYIGPAMQKRRRRDPEADQLVLGWGPDNVTRLPKADQKRYKVDKAGGVYRKAFKEVLNPVERDFNPDSPKQLLEVLQNMLAELNKGRKVGKVNLPVKKGKPSTDAVSLLKLQRKLSKEEPGPVHEFIEALITFRKKEKILNTYAKVRLDSDGRLRSTIFLAGTKSQRFRAKQTNWGTGCNLQNIPKSFRKVVVAPPGNELVQVDLSQAELRVVAWLANETKLIEMLDNKEDIHQYTADTVSRATGLEIKRQLGKRINHAANYGIGPFTFSDNCLKDDNVWIEPKVASQLLEARAIMFSFITRWQEAIKEQVRKTRTLETPHGLRRQFFGAILRDQSGRWSKQTEDMFREALSFIPQATVPTVLNLAWLKLVELDPHCLVLQQCHDSLLIQTNDRARTIDAINQAFDEQSFQVNGISRKIPWDIQVGQSWGEMEDL